MPTITPSNPIQNRKRRSRSIRAAQHARTSNNNATLSTRATGTTASIPVSNHPLPSSPTMNPEQQRPSSPACTSNNNATLSSQATGTTASIPVTNHPLPSSPTVNPEQQRPSSPCIAVQNLSLTQEDNDINMSSIEDVEDKDMVVQNNEYSEDADGSFWL
jgi:hypothetical protein